VGVDVFFVISGYLITGIILEGLARGSFSFVGFYIRRINRLFPALITVLAACFCIGWFYLLAPEFEQLGKHLVASAVFGSNFVLWNESGYFDNAAATKPLLHLWSLAIEEQFYLFWPLLLWGTFRFKIKPLHVALAIFVLSFSADIFYLIVQDRPAGFYSPASRSWELMIGGILACLSPVRMTSRLANILSLAGLALILISVVVMDGYFPYPSWRALLPTLGAAAIVAAGDKAWLNKSVFAHRAAVGLGLISYPLYLWHWPLLSFARILDSGPSSVEVRSCAVAIALALAIFTYAVIEAPFRGKTFSMTLRYKAASLSTLMVLLGGLGLLTMASKGLEARAANNTRAVNVGDLGHGPYFHYTRDHFPKCTPEFLYQEAEVFENMKRCYQSKEEERKDLAIISDSHGEDLFVGLAKELPDKNVVVYLQSIVPVLSSKEFTHIFDYVAKDRNIKTVVVAGYWTWYLPAKKVGSVESLAADLLKTVEFLLEAGKKVYVADTRPIFPSGPESCKFERTRAPWGTTQIICSMTLAEYHAQTALYSGMFESIARRHPEVTILKSEYVFCDKQECRLARDGVLLYRDHDHLSLQGDDVLAHVFVEKYGLGKEIGKQR
jgi:peptidoglycan/LPS O-acetylase OafA/YrhL